MANRSIYLRRQASQWLGTASDIATAGRPRRGDAISVNNSVDVAVRTGDTWNAIKPIRPDACWVHILNIPPGPAEAIKLRLLDPLRRPIPDSPDFPNDLRTIRRRKWRIAFKHMPPPRRNELLNNGEITADWSVVKGWIRKKAVANELEPENDDEDTQSVDGDWSD
jgi:hypothetical protein